MASLNIQDEADKENSKNVLPAGKKPIAAEAKQKKAALTATQANNGAVKKVPFHEATNVLKSAANGVKSNVQPIIEQFSNFSVYQNGNEAVTKATAAQHIKQPGDDKENVKCHKSQRLQSQINEKPLFSPLEPAGISLMCAEREHALLHEHNTSERAVNAAIPRNDRERFFEVVEYQRDILAYFRESECMHRAKPNYMQRQSDINHSMRAILIDWLVEVAEMYKLENETIFLAVTFIDRFLSHLSVVQDKLQLVGTAAMFIAAKYEEIYFPGVSEFIELTDGAYTKDQLLRMERIILKTLAFDLTTPTCYAFINTYAVLCDIPMQLKYLTLYLGELTLLQADPYLHYYPSIITAAALALAALTLNQPIWSPQLQEVTTYRLESLKKLILLLNKTHKAAATLKEQAIQTKYKTTHYAKVADITAIDLTEASLNEIIAAYNVAQKDATRKHKLHKSQHAAAHKHFANIST